MAVEPEEGNFQMLSLNTKEYPNIVLLKAGLWWRVSKLALVYVSCNSSSGPSPYVQRSGF